MAHDDSFVTDACRSAAFLHALKITVAQARRKTTQVAKTQSCGIDPGALKGANGFLESATLYRTEPRRQNLYSFTTNGSEERIESNAKYNW